MPSTKRIFIYANPHYSLLSTLLLLLILTGCAPQEEIVVPTETPQPPVLAMLFTGDGSSDALEEAVFRRTNLVIDVRTVANTGEALRALCSVGDLPVVAWLDGLTYAAAKAENCGQPGLLLARPAETIEANETLEAVPTEEADATPEVSITEEVALPSGFLTGQSGAIVVNRELGSTNLTAINGRTYCRLGLTDFYSWLLPTLVFSASGVDLTSGDATVVEYNDQGELLQAVGSGDCTMTGVSQTVVDAGLPDDVQVAQTTVPFPFAVLMYPPQVDSSTEQTLSDGLVAISTESPDVLTPLLGSGTVVKTTPEEFTSLDTFLASTGLNFAELGK
jgi:hypothetical protein